MIVRLTVNTFGVYFCRKITCVRMASKRKNIGSDSDASCSKRPKISAVKSGEHSKSDKIVKNAKNGNQLVAVKDSVLSLTKFKIKVRVLSKSFVRVFKLPNSEDEKKVFSMVFTDEEMKIRCVGFDTEVDAFYDVFEEGKVYYVTGDYLKAKDPVYNNLNHELEIRLTNTTVVDQEVDGDDSIPREKYEFKQISEISNIAVKEELDILAIVHNEPVLGSVRSRLKNRTINMKEVILVDKSLYLVKLVLWAEQAENFECMKGDVVCIKNAVVTEFLNKKQLTLSKDASIKKNLKNANSKSLVQWYNKISEDTEINDVNLNNQEEA